MNSFSVLSRGLLFLTALLVHEAHGQHGLQGAYDESEPGGSLADYDVRLAEGGLAESVESALRESQSPRLVAERERALEKLSAAIPGLRFDEQPFFGTPHFLRSTYVPLTPELGTTGWSTGEVVAQFLESHPELFELSRADLVDARVTRSFRSRVGGVHHWTLQQRFRGLDVFGAELRANVTREGALLNLGSDYVPTPQDGFRVSRFAIGPRAALAMALESVGEAAKGLDLEVESDADWPERAAFRADGWTRPISLERVYFPLSRLELRAAYHVNLAGLGGLNNYRLVLDAETGQVLWRWNAVFHAGGNEDVTFRAFLVDSPNPLSPGLPTVGSTVPAEVPRSLVTVTGASVAAQSPLGWITDGTSTTVGNNCVAHSDVLGTNVPDPRPTGTAYRVFDYPMDLTQQLNAYTAASVSNIFYWGNEYHDTLRALGFDEASGNFQEQNFGNGGVGGDPMWLETQDGGDTNNARYFHSGEGVSARLEMYPFTTTPQGRDSGLDSDVVFHELAHGTSLRLVSSLNAHQSFGMGEGWSDFIALSLNSESADDPNANYAAGAYAAHMLNGNQSSYYFGIRRYPYTTDLLKNPLTFEDIDPAQFSVSPAVPTNPTINSSPAEVHRIGEIWCMALWECRANLIATHGFAGNEIMLELVLEGMKLSPSTPNFLEARDGILQADLALNGGANLAGLWMGFAKRGLGFSASSPSAFGVAGVAESFDVPSQLFFAYPNGRPEQLQPQEFTTFEVRVAGISLPVADSGVLNYRVNGGAFVQLPMLETATGQYTASLPPLACFDRIEYSISVSDLSNTFVDPPSAPAELFEARVFEGTSVVLADEFNSDLGWTVSTGALDGGWERGIPRNNGRGDPPADADGSGLCFLTDNDPNTDNSDIDDGATVVTSPVMDLSDGAIVSYSYWFNDVPSGPLNGGDSFDVEVATNAAGTNWVLVRSYTTVSSQWRSDTVLIGTETAASSTVRFRFTASDFGTQNVVEAGLDAFDASELACAGIGTEYCYGDSSGWFCPCGNEVPLGTLTGCINSSGGGAKILATGNPSAQDDTLHFGMVGGPAGSFGVLVSGDNQLNSGLGIDSWNGLRCVGGNFRRHGGRPIGPDGVAINGWGGMAAPVDGLIAQARFQAGQTRNFQVLFREPMEQICLQGLNSSTAFSVLILP